MKTTLSFVALVALLASRSAWAEEPSPVSRDTAREIARRGAVSFDNKDWERASEQFHRAYDIVRAPTLALMEARALVQLGRLVEASDAYARAVNVKVDAENDAFRRARTDAGAELAALRPRIPSIDVIVTPDRGPAPRVSIDGVPRLDLASVPLNPGTHLVSVLRAGAPESTQSVTLLERERRTIVFEAPGTPGVATRVEGRDAPSRGASDAWMWTAFGLGGAGLATGVVTGALALDRRATLDRNCNEAACPPGLETDLRAYDRLRTASLVGYVVGFVGAAGGVVLLATRPKESDAPRISASVSPAHSGLVVSGGF
jgi:hypothetical protein